MSYWVSLNVDTGGEELSEVWSSNMTSNVSGIWRRVIGRPLHEFDQKPAIELGDAIDDGIWKASVPSFVEECRKLEPGNGWGDFESAIEYLRSIADACRSHPKTIVCVSR